MRTVEQQTQLDSPLSVTWNWDRTHWLHSWSVGSFTLATCVSASMTTRHQCHSFWERRSVSSHIPCMFQADKSRIWSLDMEWKTRFVSCFKIQCFANIFIDVSTRMTPSSLPGLESLGHQMVSGMSWMARNSLLQRLTGLTANRPWLEIVLWQTRI